MRYSRNTEWTSSDGRRVKITDLEDTHLANITDFVYKNRMCVSLLQVLIEEAKSRGLTDKFLSRAQIPYTKNGDWMIWDFDQNKEIVIE